MNNKIKITKPKAINKISLSPENNFKPTPTKSRKQKHEIYSPVTLRIDICPSSEKPYSSINHAENHSGKEMQENDYFSNDEGLINSDIEEEDIIQLQNKQLKRQNTFLKKKIQELTFQQELTPIKKKRASKEKLQKQEKEDPLSLNLNYFFKEINNLLNSLTQLFRLNAPSDLQLKNSKLDLGIQKFGCAIKKQNIFKKCVLKKSLQKIFLIEQQQKYTALLDIFLDYYSIKQEAQQQFLVKLQQMIEKAGNLNRYLLKKAQSKRMNSQIKSHRLKSQINKNELDTNKNTFSNQDYLLKAPEQAHHKNTFSPIIKNQKRILNKSP